MGLVKAITLDSGIPLPNAYHHITSLHLDYDGLSGQIVVTVHANKTARDNGLAAVKTITFVFISPPNPSVIVGSGDFQSVFGVSNLQAQDPLTATYTYLKTLASYQGASDA